MGLDRQQFRQCLVAAGKQRMLPIFLTTATTIGGLLPLAFSGGPLWEGMSWLMVFGLIVATLLTLYIVPALYAIIVETFGIMPVEATDSSTEESVETAPGIAARAPQNSDLKTRPDSAPKSRSRRQRWDPHSDPARGNTRRGNTRRSTQRRHAAVDTDHLPCHPAVSWIEQKFRHRCQVGRHAGAAQRILGRHGSSFLVSRKEVRT